MKPKNHVAFYRPTTGWPLKKQKAALGHDQFDTYWIIGEYCQSFREIVINELFRAENENHIYVADVRLLVDGARGSTAARFDRFNEVVGVLIDKKVTVHCPETNMKYSAPAELWAMAFEAMKPANSREHGRPTLGANGMTQAHLDSAKAIWFDRRYGTNTAAIEAMNSEEHRVGTGAATVGEWNPSRAYKFFGKARRRETIEEPNDG